jgi:hypothetical protein
MKKSPRNDFPKQTQEEGLRFPIPTLAKKTAVGFVAFLLAVCRMTNQSSLFLSRTWTETLKNER